MRPQKASLQTIRTTPDEDTLRLLYTKSLILTANPDVSNRRPPDVQDPFPHLIPLLCACSLAESLHVRP
jgi:hypothetical protein